MKMKTMRMKCKRNFNKPIAIKSDGNVEIRGALNEKSDVSSVADSSMTAGVVAVSRDLQPLIVANGIRIVKVS